uniref:DDHD domain containing 1b n=1 Tax=Gasterosteus aculeatus aculeatus TaxID=481459 RepID=G3NQ75_GASAC
SMSSINERPTIRQQSSENNSVSSSEWDMANDVFVSGYDDDPVGDGDVGGHRDLVRHLPILSQDGMVLGLPGDEYPRGQNPNRGPAYPTLVEGNAAADADDIPPKSGEGHTQGGERHSQSGEGDSRGGEGDSASGEGDRASGRAEPTAPRAASEETGDSDAGTSVEAVCVRGGIYEVDIREKECYPVYWNQQDRIPVMRGQWFIDGTWLPLEEDESDHIEMEHLARFRGQQMRDTYEMEVVTTTVDSKDAIDSLKLSRSHVDWHSVDEVYLYSDATTSKIARTVTQKLGFSKASSSGTRLHRGYVEEAAPEDTPPETTHIVFVVHGIGQKMDQGRIIRNTSMMRDAARKMEEKHFSNHTTEHVEFFPVEWRSKLSLDGDTVDSITPDKVRGLREMLNGSAMDIMYYTSPLYRDEITRGLTLELNRLYTLFCSRNPDFEKNGKVSIVSHSLGCVITFDIMTGWDPVRFHHEAELDPEETKVRWPSDEERHLQEQLRVTRLRLRDLENQFQGLRTSICEVPALKFKVENFFCMGSPLAVFLALRGIRPGNNGVQDHILPTSICKRLFNIFHPTDPVAYRLEPLILKHYNRIAPVQIHWYNTTSPTRYDEIRQTLLNPSLSDSESIPSPCTSPTQARRHYGESITSLGKASIMGAASLGKGIGGILFSRFSRSGGQVGGVEDDPSYPEVELERRIDFELREGLVESRYWSAVTSHTAYWCSYDVALFLLTFMYRPQEPFEPAEDNLEMS